MAAARGGKRNRGGDRPVIIRRNEIVEARGHHGGAWKVAYADFVTAMMAFFLLMWLLNATTEEQRRGLADYFSPMIAFSHASGHGTAVRRPHAVRPGRAGLRPRRGAVDHWQGADCYRHR